MNIWPWKGSDTRSSAATAGTAAPRVTADASGGGIVLAWAPDTVDITRTAPAVDATEMKRRVNKGIAALFPSSKARAEEGSDTTALLCTDYDGTLNRVIARVREHLQQNPTRKLAICTGRSLVDMKSAAGSLHDVPLKYLSLQNGSLVFENTEDLPADEWVRNLTMADCVPEYSQLLYDATHWDHQNVIQVLRDVSGENPRQMSLLYPDGAEFWSSSPQGKAIADHVLNRLWEEYGILARYEMEGSNGYKFSPVGVDKSTSVLYLTHKENPEELFTAGDGTNDVEMLAKKTYAGKRNNALVMGHRLSGVPEIDVLGHGASEDGMEKCFGY